MSHSIATLRGGLGLCLLLVVVLAAARRAHAGPPLVTDDSETPGAGGWEINVSHHVESARDAVHMDAPRFDVNYGWHDNDQLKVEFAVESLDAEHEPDRWGIGDLLFGYKYRIVDEEEAGWMASVYPQVSAPSGNRHTGLGSGSTELLAPVEVGKHFLSERLFAYAELGYNVVFDDPAADSWKYGLAAEWKSSERLEFVGEVGGFVFPQGGEPDDVFFNLGWKYKLGEHAALIGSAGRSFRDRSAGTPDFTSYLGVQFTFGGSREKPE